MRTSWQYTENSVPHRCRPLGAVTIRRSIHQLSESYGRAPVQTSPLVSPVAPPGRYTVHQVTRQLSPRRPVKAISRWYGACPRRSVEPHVTLVNRTAGAGRATPVGLVAGRAAAGVGDVAGKPQVAGNPDVAGGPAVT